MAADLLTRFRVTLDGRDALQSFFREGASGAKRFAGTVKSEIHAAGQDIAGLAGQVTRALGALTGIGADLGLARGARDVLELRDAVAGIGASAGIGAGEIAELRREIVATSVSSQQFGRDLAAGLQEFVARTGDLEAGRRHLELYGKTARATRADVREVAAIGADLEKLGITDQTRAFGILARQADAGSVELKDLASQGPRLLAAFQGAGLTGERGLRAGGALAQVFQRGTGNVERTSTAVEATFRDLALRAEDLRGGGVEVFDGEGLPRDRAEVLLEIIRKTRGREQGLRRIFGDEAMRGVGVLAAEFRRTGGFGTYESFRDVESTPGLIDQKFATSTSTALGRFQAAQIETQAALDSGVGDSLDGASEYSKLIPGAVEFGLNHPLAAGLAGGAWIGRRLAGRGISAAWSRLFGRRGGSAPGMAATGADAAGAVGAGGMPVFVTNWPGGLAPGGGGAGASLLGGLAPLLAPLVVAGATLAAAAKVLSEIGEDRDTMGARWRQEHAALIGIEQAIRRPAPASERGGQGRSEPVTIAEAARAGGGPKLAQFRKQQFVLRALATGMDIGLSDEALGKEVEGGGDVLRTIGEEFPEFRRLRGRRRSDFLRQIVEHGDLAAGTSTTTSVGQPAYWSKPQLNLTVNVNADGTATVEGLDFSTRSPRVMVHRTAGVQ